MGGVRYMLSILKFYFSGRGVQKAPKWSRHLRYLFKSNLSRSRFWLKQNRWAALEVEYHQTPPRPSNTQRTAESPVAFRFVTLRLLPGRRLRFLPTCSECLVTIAVVSYCEQHSTLPASWLLRRQRTRRRL